MRKTTLPTTVFLVATFIYTLDGPLLSLFTIRDYYFLLLISVILAFWIVVRDLDIHFLEGKLLSQHLPHLADQLYFLCSLCYVFLSLFQQIRVVLPQEQNFTLKSLHLLLALMKLFVLLGQLPLHIIALFLEPKQFLVQLHVILLEEQKLSSAFVVLAFVLFPLLCAQLRSRCFLVASFLLGLLVVDLQFLSQVSDNVILLHNDLLESLDLCLLLMHFSMQDRLLSLASLQDGRVLAELKVSSSHHFLLLF